MSQYFNPANWNRIAMGAVRPLPGVPHMEAREEEHERPLILGEHGSFEWSPSMYQEATFSAMDVSREESIYRARDWQSCMRLSEDCSIIDAPHAWRTGPADYSGRNHHYPHQRPHGLEIPKGNAPGEHWTSTEQDTSCSGGGSWTPHTSDSRSEADGTYNSQLSPWNEDARGLGICFAHAGGSPYLNDYSVSPQELQQYPDSCAEDSCVKPELQGTETGHTYYPENTGLCTPDQESIDYVPDDEPMGAPAQKRISVASAKDDDDESMDDDAEHDDDDEYTPATAGHAPGLGRGVTRGSLAARKAGLATKRSQRSKGPAFPAPSPQKVAKKPAKTQIPSPSSTRNHTPCTQCPSRFPSDSTLKKHVLSTHTRPFICTFQRYGCTATVGSKNEWKRHINVQHLHLETWRCDLDGCALPIAAANGASGQEKQHTICTPSSAVSPSLGKKTKTTEVQYHDFDRKDLFTQHIKRMHAPSSSASPAEKAAFDANIPDIQDRCHRQLRSPPPRSRCPYCPNKVFDGPGSWTDRLEHVGKHLEKNDVNKEDEGEDEELRSWMVQQGFMQWEAHKGYRVNNPDGKKKRNKSVVTTSEGEEDAEGEDEED